MARILVIDDEVAIGKLVSRILRSEHEVVAVTGGAEALGLIEGGERFDAILSDLMMPLMTGMEFHAELSRRSPELTRHLAFMTGGALTSSAEAFFDRVPNKRILKPFDSVGLRAFVRSLLDEG